MSMDLAKKYVCSDCIFLLLLCGGVNISLCFVLCRALPLGVLYSLNIGVGLLALQMVNVPMFNSLRKLVAPIILIYEYIMYNKVAESGIQLSIGVVVVGVVLAGWETFDANFVGYIMTMFNNMLTAASAIMVR